MALRGHHLSRGGRVGGLQVARKRVRLPVKDPWQALRERQHRHRARALACNCASAVTEFPDLPAPCRSSWAPSLVRRRWRPTARRRWPPPSSRRAGGAAMMQVNVPTASWGPTDAGRRRPDAGDGARRPQARRRLPGAGARTVAPVAAVASSSSIPMAPRRAEQSPSPPRASRRWALRRSTPRRGPRGVARRGDAQGVSYPAPPSVAPQGQTCTLPAPVRTSACPPGKQPVNASAPPTHTHTGSPHITHQFYAPSAPIGVMSRPTRRACVVAGAIDASDPFGPHLRGGAARG